MEETRSSETSVDFHRNARRYITGDGTLHNHLYENLNSYTKDSNIHGDILS
jgi:hypothetical protein